jgi:alkylated DNA nucleotide flippase Atl1
MLAPTIPRTVCAVNSSRVKQNPVHVQLPSHRILDRRLKILEIPKTWGPKQWPEMQRLAKELVAYSPTYPEDLLLAIWETED